MHIATPADDLARYTGRDHEAHRRFWEGVAAEVEDPIRPEGWDGQADGEIYAHALSDSAAAVLARISGGAELGRLVVLTAALARVVAAERSSGCVLLDIPPLLSAEDAQEALPIMLAPSPEDSVRDLLAATRDRISAAVAHQAMAIRRLAAPGLEAAPLLVANEALHGPGFDAYPVTVRLGSAGLRIGHVGGMPAAAALAGRINRALAGFADTAQPLANIELLSAAELEAVRRAGAGPASHEPATIWHLFAETAAHHPSRIALRAAGEVLTYAELHQRAELLGASLRTAHGIGRDALVGLVPARNAEWIIGLLGILAAGGAYLPLSTDQPEARRAALIAQARPRLLLTAGPALHGALALPLPLPLAEVAPCPGPAPADLAYVLYTSGSTGQPKGVMIAHGGFANMIRHQIAAFGIVPEDRVLQLAAASFDASLSEIFMALLAGAALVMVEDAQIADTARFTRHLAQEGVTVATITPPYLAALDRHPLPSLRVLIMAGDVADPEAARRYARDRLVFNAYGPTEVSVCASIHNVAPDASYSAVPIGRAVAGSQIHLLDRFGRLRPPGSAGEIIFEGPGVARGYLGRESDAFITLPSGVRAYRTGDAGRFTEGGDLLFLGRIDQQVKLRGHRVEPAEIAQALARHPQLREVHVAPMSGAGGQLELAAYVVPREATELWPSIAEFFVYDDLAYGAMAGDETRNAAYRAAFARHLPGRTVLEIGPGAEAVLSRMAIAAGARKVYAVEINPAVAEQARARLRAEGLAERVEVITGDITRVILPEACDVCISEIVGAIGGSEGSAILIEASRRWLKDHKAQLPARSVTQLAGISLAGLAAELAFPDAAAGYVERIFAQTGRRFDLRLCVKNMPAERILTAAGVLEDLDYRAPLAAEGQHDIRLEVTAPGSVDALLAWLHLIVDSEHPEEAVDILNSKGSWLPVVLPLSMPSPELQPGDAIVATVKRSLSENRLNPDFRIAGAFRRGDVTLGQFDCRAWHAAPGFRETPLHRAAFKPDGAPLRAAPLPAVLRAHLEAMLPSWMIPAHIIPLERLPLNSSGKVDRKALPAPPRGATASAPPTGTMEAAITATVAAVLGLPAIGTSDDFFALGGDSIRAIQVAARLGARGITLTSTDILAARSVAVMAKMAKGRPATAQGSCSGPFPPTPIQAWFLNRRQRAPHHFNQSMLLHAAQRLDPAAMARALDVIAGHHDALRARFRLQHEVWTAEILKAEPSTTVDTIDTTAEGLASACARIQASLDLGAGPLFRAAILRLPDADRLLWVVHHLVVDWVSWRALLPDLEIAYDAALRGEAPAMPPRSDGFADWAREAASRIAMPEWQEDALWWRSLAATPAARLPLAAGEDLAGAAAALTGTLDGAITATLLDAACRRYEADMQDLLLAALAVAARPLCGAGTLPVIIEGHGRETLLAPLEVSRTTGWFTSVHPVAITLAEGAAPVAAARAAMRAVPRRGLGYLLQAMRAEGVVILAEIGLNYLGRMEEDGAAAALRVADEPAGPALDPGAARPLPIEILAQVAEGRLHLTLTFTPQRIAPAAIQDLLDRMLAALTALSTEAAAAPDTRLSGLAPEALDDVLAGWN